MTHLQSCRQHNICILVLEHQVGHLFSVVERGRGEKTFLESTAKIASSRSQNSEFGNPGMR